MVKTVPVSVEDGRDTDLILGLEDPLEKGMATQFSILSAEFHGQKSLVGSMWLQRVGHN